MKEENKLFYIKMIASWTTYGIGIWLLRENLSIIVAIFFLLWGFNIEHCNRFHKKGDWKWQTLYYQKKNKNY